MPQEHPLTHGSWRTSLKSAISQDPTGLSLFFPLFHFLTLPLGVWLGSISKHTRCLQIAVLRLDSGGSQPKPPIYDPGRQENGGMGRGEEVAWDVLQVRHRIVGLFVYEDNHHDM